jgi:hypothetical protein
MGPNLPYVVMGSMLYWESTVKNEKVNDFFFAKNIQLSGCEQITWIDSFRASIEQK